MLILFSQSLSKVYYYQHYFAGGGGRGGGYSLIWAILPSLHRTHSKVEAWGPKTLLVRKSRDYVPPTKCSGTTFGVLRLNYKNKSYDANYTIKMKENRNKKNLVIRKLVAGYSEV